MDGNSDQHEYEFANSNAHRYEHTNCDCQSYGHCYRESVADDHSDSDSYSRCVCNRCCV